jgi:hypothetical protein
MALQFLSTCLEQYSIEITEDEPSKVVTVSAVQDPLPNVLVTVYYTYNGSYGYFGEPQSSPPAGIVVNENSKVYLIAALKPAFVQKNGDNEFVFDFGMDDGTGEDFDGTEAARVIFSFSSGETEEDYEANTESVVSFPLAPLNSLHVSDWLLHLEDSHFDNVAASNSYVTITIPINDNEEEAENSNLIEQMVELHLLDSSGNLRCVMDLNKNAQVTLEYAAHGFTMIALIKGHVDEDNPDQYNFEIGDPITDASVSVSSRNP